MKHIDKSQAIDLSGMAADSSPLNQLARDTTEAAFLARDVIIEAAFRKEFGNPEEMTDEQKRTAAAQIEQGCKMVGDVNHFLLWRKEGAGRRLLVEVVQRFEGGELTTSFRSEIGDLGLGDE